MLLEQRLELRLDAVPNDPARRNELVFVLLRERGADSLTISDVNLKNDYIALYKFTDIYGQDYWSEKIK